MVRVGGVQGRASTPAQRAEGRIRPCVRVGGAPDTARLGKDQHRAAPAGHGPQSPPRYYS